MRNLTLSAVTLTELQNADVSATAIDVDENIIFATSEKLSPDRELEVEIWKIDKDAVSLGLADAIGQYQRVYRSLHFSH